MIKQRPKTTGENKIVLFSTENKNDHAVFDTVHKTLSLNVGTYPIQKACELLDGFLRKIDEIEEW